MSIDNHFNLLLLIECVWYVIMLKQFYLAAWGGDLSGSFFTIINKNKFLLLQISTLAIKHAAKHKVHEKLLRSIVIYACYYTLHVFGMKWLLKHFGVGPRILFLFTHLILPLFFWVQGEFLFLFFFFFLGFFLSGGRGTFRWNFVATTTRGGRPALRTRRRAPGVPRPKWFAFRDAKKETREEKFLTLFLVSYSSTTTTTTTKNTRATKKTKHGTDKYSRDKWRRNTSNRKQSKRPIESSIRARSYGTEASQNGVGEMWNSENPSARRTVSDMEEMGAVWFIFWSLGWSTTRRSSVDGFRPHVIIKAPFLPRFTGFHQIRLTLTGFDCVQLGFNWVLPSFT